MQDNKNPIKIELFKSRTIAQTLADAKELPELTPLFGNLLHQGELVILYGDAGTGKSVLAMQIGLGVAQNKNVITSMTNHPSYDEFQSGTIDGLSNNSKKQLKVLYYDFELSERQFEMRFQDLNLDECQEAFKRVTPSRGLREVYGQANFTDFVIYEIRKNVEQESADMIILDNITWLNMQSTADANVAIRIMRELDTLKHEKNLTILVIAHTPKRLKFTPLTQNDLAGSKLLANFADGMIAIGKSAKNSNYRYIIHTKSRSTEEIFHYKNVITCNLQKYDEGLKYYFVCFDYESNHLTIDENERKQSKKELIIELNTDGLSLRKIAQVVGISHQQVKRIIEKYKKDSSDISKDSLNEE